MEERGFGCVEGETGGCNKVFLLVIESRRLLISSALQSITKERYGAVRAECRLCAEFASASLEALVFRQFELRSRLALASGLDVRDSTVTLALFASFADNFNAQYTAELRCPALHSSIAHDVRDEATVALHFHQLEKKRVTRKIRGRTSDSRAVILLLLDLRGFQFGSDIRGEHTTTLDALRGLENGGIFFFHCGLVEAESGLEFAFDARSGFRQRRFGPAKSLLVGGVHTSECCGVFGCDVFVSTERVIIIHSKHGGIIVGWEGFRSRVVLTNSSVAETHVKSKIIVLKQSGLVASRSGCTSSDFNARFVAQSEVKIQVVIFELEHWPGSLSRRCLAFRKHLCSVKIKHGSVSAKCIGSVLQEKIGIGQRCEQIEFGNCVGEGQRSCGSSVRLVCGEVDIARAKSLEEN